MEGQRRVLAMKLERPRTQNQDGFCVMTDDQVEQLRKQIAVYAVICEQLVDTHKAFTAQQDLAGSSLNIQFQLLYLSCQFLFVGFIYSICLENKMLPYSIEEKQQLPIVAKQSYRVLSTLPFVFVADPKTRSAAYMSQLVGIPVAHTVANSNKNCSCQLRVYLHKLVILR
ncbi:hypothetical protein ACLB2K_051422 [Fragaria x ananassa]